MKLVIKYIIIEIFLILYKTLWIFLPIRKNTILFISFGGNSISCNPLYLYKYMKGNASRYDMYWLLKRNTTTKELPDSEIVWKNSLRSLLLLATAKIVITNDRLPSYISFRKKQYLINTWHGGGAFKKTFGNHTGIMGNYLRLMNFKDSKRTTCYLSTSKVFSDLLQKSFQYNGFILNSGYPRNDLFFAEDQKETLKQKVKRRLDIPVNDDVILYAPTFRGNPGSASMGIIKKNPLDIERVIKAWNIKTGNLCHVLFRAHHTMREGLGTERIIDVTAYPDMQELLLISDAMITDYSSCIWDYSLTGRPCFMYAPDFKQYFAQPGFESDYRQWPAILAESNAELEDEILNFDTDEYEKKVTKYHKTYQSYETGNACQKVYNYIKSLE